MTTRDFISRLKRVRRSGNGWTAPCPAHDDKNPSLSIHERDGKILLKCFASCSTEAILAAMGLEMSDLFPDANGIEQRIEVEYDYTNEKGERLFQTVRYQPKDFKQRRPDGHGGWIWNLKGIKPVLYRLPEVLKATSVLIVEGEKDCETARRLRIVGTTNPHGSAGKWREEYSECLRGKRVCVVADADEPGLRHAREVAGALLGVAAMVKLIEALPASKDLSVWVEKGGTRESLLEIIKQAPEVKAEDLKAREVTSHAPREEFTLIPLGDLLARPDEPVEYIWEGRLPAGATSVIVSKPKVGKSTLARNLCLSVSNGHEFLGLKTKQGVCIYLALEEREDDVRNDFRAMGANGPESILIHASTAPVEGIQALCRLVRDRRPVLVVIDPLFRLVRVRDEKAYAETYAALGPLIDVARETGTHLLFCHHSGKGLKADPIDSPLGSTAIGGAVSTLVVLKRTEAYRTIQTVQRVGQDLPETVLDFDPQAKSLSLGHQRSDVDAQIVAKEIVEFLEGAEEPKAEPEIDENVDGKTTVKRKALRELVEKGKVTRQGGGKKGDPYLYSKCLFPCSTYIPGTREQECGKGADAPVNIERIVVPAFEQKSFLVPENNQGKKVPLITDQEPSPSESWETEL